VEPSNLQHREASKLHSQRKSLNIEAPQFKQNNDQTFSVTQQINDYLDAETKF